MSIEKLLRSISKNKQATGRGSITTILTATIDIEPSGQCDISFSPLEAIMPERLMRLTLCYAAKVRWLLDSEPEELLAAYKGLLQEAIDCWPTMSGQSLLEELPTAQQLKADTSNDLAVDGGERFIVRLMKGDNVGYFINNDLPQPGLALNVFWNVILLLDTVVIQLNVSDLPIFQTALINLLEYIFDERPLDLVTLNTAANEILNQGMQTK